MKIYEKQMEEFRKINASYYTKVFMKVKHLITVREKEVHKNMELYESIIDSDMLPNWFNGRCSYMQKAIEYHNGLKSWEINILNKSNRTFENASQAESYLRLERAKIFLVKAKKVYQETPLIKKIRRYDLKRLISDLEKSIANGSGVARNNAQNIIGNSKDTIK